MELGSTEMYRNVATSFPLIPDGAEGPVYRAFAYSEVKQKHGSMEFISSYAKVHIRASVVFKNIKICQQ